MLAVNAYTPDYIEACRANVEAQLAAYAALVSATGPDQAAALASFEPLFFNNLTLVLDYAFVHRTRAMEGKDGNPLNEVRMLGNAILSNHAVLAVDKTIKYKPEASVLKLSIGDDVRITEAQFR